MAEISDLESGGIYIDFINELADRGYDVYVVSPTQKRNKESTHIRSYGNVKLLRVKIGNIVKTRSFIEKGISTLTLEYRYLNAIKKYWKDINIDLLVYSTPPITFNKVIKYFKSQNNLKTYLMLKDIFPQNAVDLNILKKSNFIYKYFRKKEIELYNNSNIIGCMSPKNVEYLTNNNILDKDKIVEIFPNAIRPTNINELKEKDKLLIKEKFNLPTDKIIYIYGGSIGKPQGIDYIREVINNFHLVHNSHLLIIGAGTGIETLKNQIAKHNPDSVEVIDYMNKDDYDELLKVMDVGLIFLDSRFTIPNFPSRLISYMEYSLPILAATDTNTDVSKLITEEECGLWCESKNVNDFIKLANVLSNDKSLRVSMGEKGRKVLDNKYNISKTIEIMLKHL